MSIELCTAHYVFHCQGNSAAGKRIEEIAALQEGCYRFISSCLKTDAKGKIHYHLYDTPAEVGRQYAMTHGDGDDEPCNGFALPDVMSQDGENHIFAVYNDEVKCVGFHEDAHIISYSLGRPASKFIREGLAMFFDRYWWGIDNGSWTRWYAEQGKLPPVTELLDNVRFNAYDDALTYPMAGAFTGYLMARFGTEKYVAFYKCCADQGTQAFEQAFGAPAALLGKEFSGYIQLFHLRSDIRQLLKESVDA